MSDQLNIFATWVQILSGIGTTLAAVVAALQFFRSKRLEFQEKRPFVIPKLHLESSSRGKALFLLLRNVGDTPATSVKLDFGSEKKWHWVKSPSYPFLTNSEGITAIGPGDELKFFLGKITPAGDLRDIETRDIEVRVSFDNPVRKAQRLHDDIRMSLQDNRYQSKN